MITSLLCFKVTQYHNEFTGMTSYKQGYIYADTAKAAKEIADRLYHSSTYSNVLEYVGVETDVNVLNYALIQQA